MEKPIMNTMVLVVFFIVSLLLFFKNEESIIEVINNIFSTEKMDLNIKKTQFNIIVKFATVGFIVLVSIYCLHYRDINAVFLNKERLIKLIHIVTSLSFILIMVSIATLLFFSLKINPKEDLNIESFVNYLGTKKMNNMIDKLYEYNLITYKGEMTSSPECCTRNDFKTTGCLCVEPVDIKYIQQRGGNQHQGDDERQEVTHYEEDHDEQENN